MLQKRIVQALTNSDFHAHTAPLFIQLKILDIYKINTFHVAKFMFSYHHRLLPPSFHNLFITSHQVHSYNTRSSNLYRSHLCKTNTKHIIVLFVETTRKFITAKLSIRKPGSSSVLIICDLFNSHTLFIYKSVMICWLTSFKI